MIKIPFLCFSNMQKSLSATLGDDEYSTARKEVLTHMCSRPMQVRANFNPAGQ